jgi:hypothetical protein
LNDLPGAVFVLPLTCHRQIDFPTQARRRRDIGKFALVDYSSPIYIGPQSIEPAYIGPALT